MYRTNGHTNIGKDHITSQFWTWLLGFAACTLSCRKISKVHPDLFFVLPVILLIKLIFSCEVERRGIFRPLRQLHPSCPFITSPEKSNHRLGAQENTLRSQNINAYIFSRINGTCFERTHAATPNRYHATPSCKRIFVETRSGVRVVYV